jgi:4,5-DOPA dioxygenase extradiol
MFPDADVPVVQLAINAAHPLELHVELGALMNPLRDKGILIVGSGNVVHNLGMIDPRLAERGFDWAERFDEAGRDVMTTDPGDVGRLAEHPDFRRAVPTPDHFIPLLYVAGVGAAADAKASVIVDGYGYGSLSMTCYAVAEDPKDDSTG